MHYNSMTAAISADLLMKIKRLFAGMNVLTQLSVLGRAVFGDGKNAIKIGQLAKSVVLRRFFVCIKQKKSVFFIKKHRFFSFQGIQPCHMPELFLLNRRIMIDRFKYISFVLL